MKRNPDATSAKGRVSRSQLLPVLIVFALILPRGPLHAEETGTPGVRTVVPAATGGDELARRLAARVARPGGLTADEATRRAVATSAERRSRQADVEGAEAEVDRAEVGYYPRLTATARYTRLSPLTAPSLGPPGFAVTFPVILDQYLVQANVIVPLSDYLLRIRQNHDASQKSREAARATEEAARRAVGAQAKIAYYAWARTRLQEVVTAQSVEQARRHVEMARAARETGRLPEVEVLRAESLLASAELFNQRMKNLGLLAEARLRSVMHDEARAPLEIGEDLLAPLAGADPGSSDSLYVEALSRRAEMRAFASSNAALGDQRRAAAATGLPRLDAFGNAYLANPSPRVIPQEEKWRATWDVGAQVTWSPNDLGGAAATARSIDAKQKKLDAERAAVADSTRDEISAASVAWRESRAAAATAERGLTAAEEAYRVRRELFELGRGTNVELIDAESDVLRARLEMVQAKVDGRIATVRLEHAVGRDGPTPGSR